MILDLEKEYKGRVEEIWTKQRAEHPETNNADVVKLGYAIERQLLIEDVLFLG